MKKILLALLGSVLCLSLVACGSDKESNNKEEIIKKEFIPTEQVVVDNENYYIKLIGNKADNYWGYAFTADFENKSVDITYEIMIDFVAISGIEAECPLYVKLGPGEKATKKIELTTYLLEHHGVTEFTDVELIFEIHDVNDSYANDKKIQTNIYPCGAENAANYVRELQPNDDVIIDNEYIKIYYTGYKQEELMGYLVYFHVVNKTDHIATFNVNESLLNGHKVNSYLGDLINPGKSSFETMHFSTDVLDENNIKNIKKIELVFSVNIMGGESSKEVFNDKITIKP